MASLPPSACCVSKTLHEGTAVGSLATIGGLETYVTGADNGNDTILVVVTDIYGHKLINTQLVADEFAKLGKYHVLIPDILNDDGYDASKEELPVWLQRHKAEDVGPLVKNYLAQVRKQYNPKHLLGVGYCFGAKYVIQNLSEDGAFDVGAGAHPSFVDVAEVEKVTKPFIISAAQTDPIFTVELRHKTEEILSKNDVTYQIDLFSKVVHGFTIKGDISVPQVKYAKEKALLDQIAFFTQNK